MYTVLLERQGEPVDVQTWLCQKELGYGVLHVLLYCAPFFGKLLGCCLQVQSLYFKKNVLENGERVKGLTQMLRTL